MISVAPCSLTSHRPRIGNWGNLGSRSRRPPVRKDKDRHESPQKLCLCAPDGNAESRPTFINPRESQSGYPTKSMSPPRNPPPSPSPSPSFSSSPGPSSLHPTSISPSLRLQSIAGHMSQSVPTSFSAEAVPQAPEDPLFGLMAAYRADTFDKKVDLGIGAYRDNDAKPWILPVVKKVIQSLHELEQLLTQSSRQRRSSVMTPP
jgi:hypothetical protein